MRLEFRRRKLALKKRFVALFLLISAAILTGATHGSQLPVEVHASDVMEKIARGDDVDYDNAVITGDIDLSDLNLPRDEYGSTIIASKIRINNSKVKGDLNFAFSKFSNQVSFHGTAFQGNVNISDSRFASLADFGNARFLGQADSIMADSSGGWLYLSKSTFSKGASFEDAVFDVDSYFESASFKGEANFRDAIFNGYADLAGCRFYDNASFYRAEFSQETHFDEARFSNYANFSESRFKDYAYFIGTDFQGPISLNKTKIADWVIVWDSIDGHLVYNNAAYQALLQKLWTSGDFDAYDDCYYQYRWQMQLHEPMGIDKILGALAWALCGYGVRPLHTVAFGILLIIFFGIIYWKANLVQSLQSDKQTDSLGHDRSRISALEESMYFSAMMFLTRPPYGLQQTGRLRYLTIIEYISGWLIMAIFLLVLVRIIIL
jgi:hypothetical protein